MSKFTKGPWAVCGMNGGWTGVKPSAHNLEICKLVENNEANAALIAAAPEMWDALQICKARLGKDFPQIGHDALAKAVPDE